jgi:hypothetical protein
LSTGWRDESALDYGRSTLFVEEGHQRIADFKLGDGLLHVEFGIAAKCL